MSLDNLEYSVMLTSLAKKAGEVSIPVTRLASLLIATGLVTVGQLVLAQVYRVYTKPVLDYCLLVLFTDYPLYHPAHPGPPEHLQQPHTPCQCPDPMEEHTG